MKKFLIVFVLIVSTNYLLAQEKGQGFLGKINEATRLFYENDYKKAALTFSSALHSSQGNTANEHMLYIAISANALSGEVDSAFSYMNQLVNEKKFNEYQKITLDKNLVLLHQDSRWKILVNNVRINQKKALPNINEDAAEKLITIHNESFDAMMKMNTAGKKYGWHSKEYNLEYDNSKIVDSSNVIKIIELIDKYGWLGPNLVGEEANRALYVALQNSNTVLLKKHLTTIRSAFKRNEITGNSLAIIEDKILLAEGKNQLYGTQIRGKYSDKDYTVLPLQDPDNVDKRRSELGLPSLADFLSSFNTKWNVEQYKKDLTKLEKEYFAEKNFH